MRGIQSCYFSLKRGLIEWLIGGSHKIYNIIFKYLKIRRVSHFLRIGYKKKTLIFSKSVDCRDKYSVSGKTRLEPKNSNINGNELGFLGHIASYF